MSTPADPPSRPSRSPVRYAGPRPEPWQAIVPPPPDEPPPGLRVSSPRRSEPAAGDEASAP